ncbi:cytochrome b/b6 domain-containing protein [Devosia sp. MC532]|uniref:cytochrome b n=1 Tax=Devosia sp. MC532 TaxID=2799788 RepID=UPI0018F6C0C6|nr:cytochrome b/b6 domain-containing protein [Devosia sp. MC532]MBJ7579495.1 cytochrome b/b6 domain-containing protein [Devosia sp. MC532]
MKSSSNRYGRTTALLHWISALIVILMLASGQALDWAPQSQVSSILPFHVSLGLLLGVLTLARAAWWIFFDKHPAPHVGMTAGQERAAKAVHLLLYGAIVVMVGSGVAMLLLSGAGSAVFSGGALPRFSTLPPFGAHTIFSKILLLLVIGHIGAALWHQLVIKDNLLARMRPH